MKRLMTALASIALIGTLFVGAPKPVFAVGGADTYYVGFGGGSDAGCGVPDYDLDYGREGYNDGDSWEYTSNDKLEDALYEFFNNDGDLDVTDGDTIVICDGWFHMHDSGYEWNGDLTPGVDVDPSTITIRGLGKNNTFITGDEPGDNDPFDGIYRPFYFYNTNLILEDMTIMNTSAVYDDESNSGGAIYLDGGSLTVDNVDFVNFTSDDADGGAITVIDADLTVTDSTFDQTSGWSFYESDNNDGSGGAIYAGVSSASIENLTVSISDSEFNNIGTMDNGGAIYVECASTTVTNTDFYDNTAGIAGGAIYAYGYNDDCDTTGSLTIDQSLFEGNYLHNNFGGGDSLGGGAVTSIHQPVTVTDSQFGDSEAGNSTGGRNADGGALFIDGTSGTLVAIEDSNFFDNYADGDGGAIYTHCVNLNVTGDDDGELDEDAVSSVFADNYADNDGGAIYVGAEDCNDDSGDSSGDEYVTADVTGTSFYANEADEQGGAIATNQTGFNWLSSLDVHESTFWYNRVYNSAGGAINSDYVDVSIHSSSFEGNASERGGVFEGCGANLRIEDSYFTNNYSWDRAGVAFMDDGCGRDTHDLTVINSTFEENGADENGGVFEILSGRPLVTFTGSTFTDNTSGYGGGVAHIYDATTNITDSSFERNIAWEEGGAIDYEDSNSLTIRRSNFIDNSSGYRGSSDDGGAIDFGTDWNNVYLGVFDSLFQGNYATDEGGAIWARTTNIGGLVEVSNSRFIGNSAEDEGGALWVDLNDEGTMTIDRTTFDGNSSLWEDGGAINQDTDDDGTFVRITNSRFTNNFADSDGGAMDLTDYAVLTNNTFTGNSVEDGYGGALELNDDDSNDALPYVFSVTGNTFTNNTTNGGDCGTCGADGGAISVEARAIITGNQFVRNSAGDDGGAISLEDNSETAVSVISGNTFSENSSNWWGGAVQAGDDVSLRITSNTFARNVSRFEGGAVLAGGDDDVDVVYTIDKNTFIGNRSLESDGGALYLEDITFPGSSVTNNLFDGNSAAAKGGAMYVDFDSNPNDFKVMIASNRVIRNTAQNGAGLYLERPTGATATQLPTGIARNTFERNVASQNGGAVMMEYLGGTYRNARAALQSLQKAVKNNRYKSNKANLDRATGDVGGWPVSLVMIGGTSLKVASVEEPEAK